MIHLYKSPVHTILDRNLNFVMKKISVLWVKLIKPGLNPFNPFLVIFLDCNCIWMKEQP